MALPPPRATGGHVQPHSHGPRLPGVHMTPGQLTTPGPEWVAIHTEAFTGPLAGGVLGLLLDPPKVLGGGGLESVARPGRRPLTPYRGTETLGLSLTFLIDQYAEGKSIEPYCRVIEIMAGMFLPDDPGPQLLIVQGKAVPHCSGASAFRHRWKIGNSGDDIWADDPATIRRPDGKRTRQAISLELWLDTEADELKKLPPQKAAPNFKVAVAKDGDTYRKIAKRALGEPRLGRKLAQLNDDKDPLKKLAQGTRVRLPSDHLKGLWLKDLKAGK